MGNPIEISVSLSLPEDVHGKVIGFIDEETTQNLIDEGFSSIGMDNNLDESNIDNWTFGWSYIGYHNMLEIENDFVEDMDSDDLIKQLEVLLKLGFVGYIITTDIYHDRYMYILLDNYI